MSTKPLFDADLVVAALGAIRDPEQVIEVRVLDATTRSSTWEATQSGYFNDATKVVEALKSVRTAKGIYLTLNPVNPALLARAQNRLRKAGKGDSTSDNDIKQRRWLPIDADAVRPAGISSTDEEHDLALAREENRQASQASDSNECQGPVVVDNAFQNNRRR
jgi:hypothetical protein